MDTSNWRSTQGGSGSESGDWRSQLQADSRERTVNTIMDALKRHLPLSGHEGLQELKKIAVRIEEKIYTAATSQPDYLQKISLKMLTMETGSQNPMPDAIQSNSAANSVTPSDPASLDSTAQTGNPNGGDWQEEVYQKIKAMKDLYLLDLNDMHQKILGKLQQYDSLPQQLKNEQVEKLKVFKNMLEHFMAFLQIPKHDIPASYKDKLGTYEKQIVSIIDSNRRKPAATQQQTQALPPPHLPSVQQSQQNNTGSLQQNSVSSVPGASNAKQNMMSSIQPNSNLDPGENNSTLNSLQQAGGGSLQQNALSGSQQGNINPLSSHSGMGLNSIIRQQMDMRNWRPTQGGSANGGDDWRSQLQADSRQRIVNKLVETLKIHLPYSGDEGLQELKEIALRFEKKIYAAATSQMDYLRKISFKMLTMETRPQNPMPDTIPSYSTAFSVNPSDPGAETEDLPKGD